MEKTMKGEGWQGWRGVGGGFKGGTELEEIPKTRYGDIYICNEIIQRGSRVEFLDGRP